MGAKTAFKIFTYSMQMVWIDTDMFPNYFFTDGRLLMHRKAQIDTFSYSCLPLLSWIMSLYYQISHSQPLSFLYGRPQRCRCSTITSTKAGAGRQPRAPCGPSVPQVGDGENITVGAPWQTGAQWRHVSLAESWSNMSDAGKKLQSFFLPSIWSTSGAAGGQTRLRNRSCTIVKWRLQQASAGMLSLRFIHT